MRWTTKTSILISLLSSLLFGLAAVTPAQAATQSDVYSHTGVNLYQRGVCLPSFSSDGASTVGTPAATGASNAETIFRYLISTNVKSNNGQPMNAIQAAAVVGNLQQESSLNPGADNGHYAGIAQWSYASLTGDRVSGGRLGKIATPWHDLDNQLALIVEELDNHGYGQTLANNGFWELTTETDLSEAAFLWGRNFEVAIENGGGPTSYSNDTAAENYLQDYGKRRDYARAVYAQYGDLAPGTSAAGCAGGNGSAVIVEGRAWPIQGATKAKTKVPGLSLPPCDTSVANSCHGGRREYNDWAVDLGLNQGGGGLEISKGVKVLAIGDGRIVNIRYQRRGNPCNQFTYQVVDDSGQPIEMYWYGHLAKDTSYKNGDTFKVGDVIGEIGSSACADSTQSHLHIDKSYSATTYQPKGDGHGIGYYELINALFEALPE
jgi:murein DD-endopeptidase MepM/ murein hydrolase activator NlpD